LTLSVCTERDLPRRRAALSAKVTSSAGGKRAARAPAVVCLSLGRGQVALLDVVPHHAIAPEVRDHGGDGGFQGGAPVAAQAAGVLLEEDGDGLLLEDPVEGGGVGRVLLLRRRGLDLLADGPAVVAAEALHPPAVEDAEVDAAVDGALLA